MRVRLLELDTEVGLTRSQELGEGFWTLDLDGRSIGVEVTAVQRRHIELLRDLCNSALRDEEWNL